MAQPLTDTHPHPGAPATAAEHALDGVISLGLYLRHCHGWSRWMLSADGIALRVHKSNGKWHYVPHRRVFRLLRRRRLCIDAAFHPNMRLRFLPSLRWQYAGASIGVAALALVLGGIGYAGRLLDTPAMEGWIEGSLPSREPAEFPYGEWVRVTTSVDHRERCFWIEDCSGTAWKLSAMVLTCPADVEIDLRFVSKQGQRSVA